VEVCVESAQKGAEMAESSQAGNAREEPIDRIMQTLLQQAADEGAAEIVIEPLVQSAVVRYRNRGVLREVVRLPKAVSRQLVEHLRERAGIRGGEQTVAEEGRIELASLGKEYELRVTAQPSPNGETLVIHISPRQQAPVAP
jgi:type II secretory ATPase GspE/PulE/Tfp pilus assembly ATPase PilB-like protein